MKNGGAEQDSVDVLPGFSPRPASTLQSVADDSPSGSDEPDTHTPSANLEGPVLLESATPQPTGDIVIKDGIVSFQQ